MKRFTFSFAVCAGVFLLAYSAQAGNDIIEATDANGNIITDINGNPAVAVESTEPDPSFVMFKLNALDPVGTTGVFLTASLPPPGATVDAVGVTPSFLGGIAVIFFDTNSVDCSTGGCIGPTGQLQDVTDLTPGIRATVK